MARRLTTLSVAVVVAFLSLPIAALLFGRRFRGDPVQRVYARPSFTLGVLQFATVALNLASPGSRKGITERLLIALDLIWLTGMSVAPRARSEPR